MIWFLQLAAPTPDPRKPTPRELTANREHLRRILSDNTAWENEFAKGFYAFLRRAGHSHEECQDILQETRVRAWSRREEFRGEARATTYLTGIGRNCSHDVIRGNARRRDREVASFQPNLGDDSEVLSPLDRVAAPGLGPEGETIKKETLSLWQDAVAEVRRRFEAVPNEAHRVIMRTYTRPELLDALKGRVYEALAVETGLPEKQVPENVKRAKRKARLILAQVADERELDEDFVNWVEVQWKLRER